MAGANVDAVRMALLGRRRQWIKHHGRANAALLLLARDIQAAFGVPPQAVMTTPILPGIDGVKRMSKSEGNYVGVTEPPEEMFGKLMRVPDDLMPTYYDLLLDTPFDPARPAVESKRQLAREVVARYHSPEVAASAEAHFDRLHVEHGIPDEIDEERLPDQDPVHLPALLADSFGVSRSEVLGKTNFDVFSSDQAAQLSVSDQQALASVGTGIVTQSIGFRFLLSSIFLVKPMVCPYQVCGSFAEAWSFVSGQGRKRDVIIPPVPNVWQV